MRYDPFLGKRLADLSPADLEDVVNRGVVEGLFVEYKRDFRADKVARAVASFANSEGGGTLIVGIDAEKLRPTKVVGSAAKGDLVENAVAAIRSSVDPVPDFDLVQVPFDAALATLVVQVPPGRQPPYVFVPTGQVLIRTHASSDPVRPNDRDSLDRLFARGDRGRTWASGQLDAFVLEHRGRGQSLWLGTFPAVDGGLYLHPLIFKPSAISKFQEHHPHAFPHPSPVEFVTEKDAVYLWQQMVYSSALRVRKTGVLETSWARYSDDGKAVVDSDYWDAKKMVEMVLPAHRKILEGVLGYRGEVSIAIAGAVRDETGGTRGFDVSRRNESMDRLDDGGFHASILREFQRQLSRSTVLEPEDAE